MDITRKNISPVPSGQGTENKPAVAIFYPNPVSYDDGIRLQDQLVKDRINGETIDTVLFLEHTPVFTMGIRTKNEHILLPEDDLKKRGFDLKKSARGGDVTYHGPGQLVVYPVLKLTEPEADVHNYVAGLEEVALQTAAHFGVSAFRRKNMTGIWTSAGKLAAIGVRLKKWVTYHGMSFNVNPDLSPYEMIVPCGLKGEPVTSLEVLMKRRIGVPEVRDVMALKFAGIFQRNMRVSRSSPYPRRECASAPHSRET